MSADSAYKAFTNVMPSDIANWDSLGATDTMTKIALGVKAVSVNEWRELLQTQTLYSKEVIESPIEKFVGTLDPNTQSKLVLTANHGNAFSQPVSVKYKLTFIFNLAE